MFRTVTGGLDTRWASCAAKMAAPHAVAPCGGPHAPSGPFGNYIAVCTH